MYTSLIVTNMLTKVYRAVGTVMLYHSKSVKEYSEKAGTQTTIKKS